ncbi:MAG: P-II family nitrogen regulator [Nitrososphaeraceae archaeon]
MKQIQIIIPDRALKDVDGILKDAQVGGMTHYRVEGRGTTKAEAVAGGRGTMRYTPEYIPRTKVEAVIKDEQVDMLLDRVKERLGVGEISGKIFVLEVPTALDIKTGARGESAI